MYTLTKVTALSSYKIVGIAYSPDHNAYIAVSSGSKYWFYSTNATSWTTVSSSKLTGYAYNIVYDNVNKIFIVRTESSIDNINFNTKIVTNTNVNTSSLGSYIECIDGIVYCRKDSMTNNVESVFYTSTNSGKTFTQRTMPTDPEGISGCWYVFKKVNNKIYCFAQSSSTFGRIYVSNDGINFRFLQRTKGPLSGDYGICDIKYINGYYIAVGRKTFISFDGEYFFFVPTNSGSDDSVFNQSFGDHVEILVDSNGKLHATRNTTSSITENNIILPTPNKLTKNIGQFLDDIYHKIYINKTYS